MTCRQPRFAVSNATGVLAIVHICDGGGVSNCESSSSFVNPAEVTGRSGKSVVDGDDLSLGELSNTSEG